MATEYLGDRRRALEDSFFHLDNERLLDEFREHLGAMERKAQLTDASGIHDDAVLSRLLEMNIRPETLAALTLVPLIEVAWAEGKMPPKTREAVLRAAEAAGIDPRDDAHQLLEAWLVQKPDEAMLAVWKDYVQVLCEKLNDEAKDRLKHDLLDRARTIAEAAGGFLGFGRISPEERAMLDELEQVFR